MSTDREWHWQNATGRGTPDEANRLMLEQAERIKALETELTQARADAAEYRRAMHEIATQRDVEASRADAAEDARDEAVADNAALLQLVVRDASGGKNGACIECGNIGHHHRDCTTGRVSRDHRPGTALLEEHRKALVRARNEGLEEAASRIEKEASAVERAYAERRNAGGTEEPVVHAVAAVIRGAAAIVRAMKGPEE